MPATTKIAGQYRLRLVLIAAMCLFWTVWSLYDGLVAYPAQNRHAEVHDFLFEGEVSDVPRAMKQQHWIKFAQERGLPEGNSQANDFPEDQQFDLWRTYAVVYGLAPDAPPKHHSESSIFTQFIMAAITAPIGLIFLFSYLTSYRRWIRSDEEQVSTNAGQNVPYNDITRLDKERWKAKGIATVHYETKQGAGKIILDDWKFDRPTTDIVLRDIEANLGDDQIINGEREPDYEALAEQDQQRLEQDEANPAQETPSPDETERMNI